MMWAISNEDTSTAGKISLSLSVPPTKSWFVLVGKLRLRLSLLQRRRRRQIEEQWRAEGGGGTVFSIWLTDWLFWLMCWQCSLRSFRKPPSEDDGFLIITDPSLFCTVIRSRSLHAIFSPFSQPTIGLQRLIPKWFRLGLLIIISKKKKKLKDQCKSKGLVRFINNIRMLFIHTRQSGGRGIIMSHWRASATGERRNQSLVRSTHTFLSKIEEEEEGGQTGATTSPLFHMCVCARGFLYTRGVVAITFSEKTRERGVSQKSSSSSSRPARIAEACRISAPSFLLLLCTIFFLSLPPICSLIWRVPLSCLSVCLCALLLAIQARKNNKPRDTIQILDVISLLSGSKGKEEMCAYCTRVSIAIGWRELENIHRHTHRHTRSARDQSNSSDGCMPLMSARRCSLWTDNWLDEKTPTPPHTPK
jgi:hypothetical protein